MGELNAKKGNEKDGEIVSKCGSLARHERRVKCVQLCTKDNQVVTKTRLQEHTWIWKSPGR